MNTKMETLDKTEMKYCKGLMDRFANMGIGKAAAESAVCHMIERDAVPTGNIYAATPSMFPKGESPSMTLNPAMTPSLSA